MRIKKQQVPETENLLGQKWQCTVYFANLLCISGITLSYTLSNLSQVSNFSSSRALVAVSLLSEIIFTLYDSGFSPPIFITRRVRIVIGPNFFTAHAVRKYHVLLSVTSITSNELVMIELSFFQASSSDLLVLMSISRFAKSLVLELSKEASF